MKKNFKFYIICWAILLAFFNVICFVTPNEAAGLSKFGGAFWVGYIFITAAFIGQLVCAYIAFKAENLKKLFYNLPLITLSYAGLVLMLVFGGAAMAIPDLPCWTGAVICLLILGFNAIAVIKAKAAADIVSNVDEKIKTQTQFIRTATADAQSIMNRAKSEAVKAECKKVYDAIRYSDPMSSDTLSVIEAKIAVKMDELTSAVNENNTENVEVIANEIIAFIDNRNQKCKLLK